MLYSVMTGSDPIGLPLECSVLWKLEQTKLTCVTPYWTTMLRSLVRHIAPPSLDLHLRGSERSSRGYPLLLNGAYSLHLPSAPVWCQPCPSQASAAPSTTDQ